VELVTPNYGRIPYPPEAQCSCELETMVPTGQPRSLNATVLDISMEVCSGSDANWDTVTISGIYDFQAE